MSLREKIKIDLEEALKKKDKIALSVLRLLSSAIHNREIEKKAKLRLQPGRRPEEGELTDEEIAKEGQLTDGETVEAILSEIKKRKEAILEFEKGEREDLAEKEKAEVEILQKYLPKQLSEEEIKKLTKEAIEKVGAASSKDMGKIMQELAPKVKGRAEGSLVSRIVKELLQTQ